MVDALLSHKTKEEAQGIATNVPSLVLAAQHVADIVSQGFHGRNRPGTGEEFWQYRQYQHGDAVRQRRHDDSETGRQAGHLRRALRGQ